MNDLFNKPCHSFQQWSEMDFRIKKGAKSPMRSPEGVPQFTVDQVYFVGDLYEVDGMDDYFDHLDILDSDFFH